jgi:hypothetical protein
MSDITGEPRGRSATGAVIIAVIFLAVLGTGVGIVLGVNAKPGENLGVNSTGTTPTVSAPGPSADDDSSDAGSGSEGTSTKKPTPTKSYKTPTKNECPQATVEAAGAPLTLTIYIRTNRAEVWICSGGGRLVYQGHNLGTPFTGATTNSTLFIGSVNYEAGIWGATNKTTRYLVSRERLKIEENGTVTVDELVVDRYEG